MNTITELVELFEIIGESGLDIVVVNETGVSINHGRTEHLIDLLESLSREVNKFPSK